MYKINENIEIIVNRDEANFDYASNSAYHMACSKFGVDEDGYCKYVENWDRSTDMIIVEFKSYYRIGSMIGQDHVYTFIARIERNNE